MIFRQNCKRNCDYYSEISKVFLHQAWICLMTILVFYAGVSHVYADSSDNTLYRIQVRPHGNTTRLIFKLEKTPDYSLTLLPGKRIRLSFPDTLSLQSKKLLAYSDAHIAHLSVSRRNNNLNVVVAMKDEKSGYRLMSPVQGNLLTLEIGPGLAGIVHSKVLPGRERIWGVTEKIIREFRPPLRSDAPFIPSDPQLLKKYLPAGDVKLFQKGEAALYKERPAEAEEIFSSFMNRDMPIRMIAVYRLGEARYMLQKFNQALICFREGQRLDPEYIAWLPDAVFYYADCLARNGDFEAGRSLLGRLIAGLAGTSHAAPLLVRLADISAREGREMLAFTIYKNVVNNFAGNKAVNQALIRLLDREYYIVDGDSYESLLQEYKKIYALGVDAALQEESLFKAVLLQAMYGPPAVAVADVAEYEKRYPNGVFLNVSRVIREDLLLLLYSELKKNGDCKGMLKMVAENRNYLARCLSDESFAGQISNCFHSNGMLKDEMNLFVSMVDSEWAVSSAPFLYRRIIEDAQALQDYALAEAAGRAFLERFPRSAMTREVLETLGFLCYRRKDMPAVVGMLSWLNEKGCRPGKPESFYYLGKAMENMKNISGAEKAMIMFMEELKSKGSSSPFQVDACLVNATARLARGDRSGAMTMYRAGYDLARGELRDTFLYKIAELTLLQGNSNEAGRQFEKLAREGSDPFWKNLAIRKLADMQWQDKWNPHE